MTLVEDWFDGFCQKTAVSSGEPCPNSAGLSKRGLVICSHRLLLRRNGHNSGSPCHEQMQVISKQSRCLTVSSYRVRSPVSLYIFREFISELERNSVQITDTHSTELPRLREEFGFSELAANLSESPSSMRFKEAEDSDACR
jgi:hypothetical protein